jgi:hypothetical protein
VVQNAIESQATAIIVDIIETTQVYRFLVADNGQGMDKEQLTKATSPFSTDRRKHQRDLGLGLPFLKQSIEQASGQWDIVSQKDFGTSVSFNFDKTHIDTPALGDIVQTIWQLISFNKDSEMLIHRWLNEKHYSVSRADLTHSLGNLCYTGHLALAKQYIQSLENDLHQLRS